MSNWHEVIASTMPDDDNELPWWRTTDQFLCGRCGHAIWLNDGGGWSMSTSDSATTTCVGTGLLHAPA